MYPSAASSWSGQKVWVDLIVDFALAEAALVACEALKVLVDLGIVGYTLVDQRFVILLVLVLVLFLVLGPALAVDIALVLDFGTAGTVGGPLHNNQKRTPLVSVSFLYPDMYHWVPTHACWLQCLLIAPAPFWFFCPLFWI